MFRLSCSNQTLSETISVDHRSEAILFNIKIVHKNTKEKR